MKTHAFLVLLICSIPATLRAATAIDFNRDVRPILSENCFSCHGPDKNKRKADPPLRLDTAGDSARLYQLANLNDRRLGPGPFVVAEVDGHVIGFLSLAGGAPVVDPAEPAKNLVSLLELRAAQIRRTDRRFRLLPRLG